MSYVTLSCILSTTCVNHQHQPHWQFLVFSILSYFSRFETTLLSCTLFLESHLINTTSPHFQLPFIDIYYSLLLLLFYWNTAHKMVCNTANVFLKKFFQLDHIVNLLQVISKCIVNYIIYGGWLHNSENSTYSMCSLPTCNHILIANDIISPCTLLYLSNKIIPYHIPYHTGERITFTM